jgi:hypothetical protein
VADPGLRRRQREPDHDTYHPHHDDSADHPAHNAADHPPAAGT